MSRNNMTKLAKEYDVDKQIKKICSNLILFRGSISQKVLVEKCKISINTYQISINTYKKLESYKRYPNIETLLTLANYYSISIDSFLNGNMNQTNSIYTQQDITNIGIRLSDIRKNFGYTEKDISDILDLDVRSYKTIESNTNTKGINLVYALILCQKYKCNLDNLLFNR